MELNEIQSLIKLISKSNVTEVEYETKEYKICIKSGNKKGESDEPTIIQTPVMTAPLQAVPQMPAAQPATQAVAAPAPAPAGNQGGGDDNAEDANLITIKSPMIGTFYRASSPDKPPFAAVGDTIKEGDVICIVEAMKLFNEIESEVSGKIVKVLVDDSSPVEYDQPLFLVDPS